MKIFWIICVIVVVYAIITLLANIFAEFGDIDGEQ